MPPGTSITACAFLLFAAAAPTGAADRAIAPTCPVSYDRVPGLDARFDQAARDLDGCVLAGGITPRAARRGRAALAQLRDLAAYDERRAWGTANGVRERLYERRLHALMTAIVPPG